MSMNDTHNHQNNFSDNASQNPMNLSLFDSVASPIFVVNVHAGITFWNSTCKKNFDNNSNELNPKEILTVIFPNQDIRRRIKQQLKDSDGNIVEWEYVHEAKQGGSFAIKWTAKPFSLGKDADYLVVGQDITELKNTQKKELDCLKRYDTVVNSAMRFHALNPEENPYHTLGTEMEKHVKNCIYIVGSLDEAQDFFTIEGVYGINSEEWENVLNFLGWNPVGRRFKMLPEIFDTIGKGELLKSDKKLYDFTGGEVASVPARSIERFFGIKDVYSIGIETDGRLIGGVVCITRSLIDKFSLSLIEELVCKSSVGIESNLRKKKLLASKVKAEESDNLKSAFLANLSHEIRTPMNAILGFSQLLGMTGIEKSKRMQYVDIINQKGRMLLKLTNDIIDASKVEAGQLTLVHQPFRLNVLMRNLKTFYDKERVFQKREAISIDLELPENTEELEIVSDEGRIEQILTNLLSNALKYTEKGSIRFGYLLQEEFIEFFVEDTGVGIDSNKQNLIFDRFRQFAEETSRSQTGTGLGLAISKGLVELLGGDIWVESTPGDGATFRFTIPVVESYQRIINASAVDTGTDSITPNWKNKVVLIAEDEEVNYLFIKELIEPTGAKVLWAQDGAQAVELVSTIKNIDVILMDIKMPNMNGYAATLEIRQIEPKIPIIAQTAYAYTEDREKAQAAGCDAYLTKPINSRELIFILDKYLG